MSEGSPINYLRHRIASTIEAMYGAELVDETTGTEPKPFARAVLNYGGKLYTVTISEAED